MAKSDRLLGEMQHASGDFLSLVEPKLLTEITPAYLAKPGLPRPITSLAESSLFTGAQTDPPLANELALEMAPLIGWIFSFHLSNGRDCDCLRIRCGNFRIAACRFV